MSLDKKNKHTKFNPKEFPLAGWIPTVAGRLSFRHIGEGRHPTESIFVNINDANDRLVLAYQKRPLSDALFPWAVHRIFKLNGDFWFALAIHSKSDPKLADQLAGRIYIFKSKEDWRSKSEGVARPAIKAIEAERFSSHPNRAQKIIDRYDKARKNLESEADIALSFVLDRSGEVAFASPIFADRRLEASSAEFAKTCGHDFGRWVADQAYFFLRDVSHSHQHHSPHTDTLLILQDRDPQDIHWRENIIYSLYYSIIRTKRMADTFAPIRSLGLHAYAKSFQNVCAQKLGAAFRKFPNFNDEELAQSLRAKAEELTAEATLADARAMNIRTGVFAISAIYIATIAILVQPRLEGENRSGFPWLFWLSEKSAEYFFILVGICILAIIATYVLTNPQWLLQRPFFRDLLELSNVIRVKAIAFWLAITALVIGLTLWAFSPATLLIWDSIKYAWHQYFGT